MGAEGIWRAQLNRLVAIVHPENQASIRVVQKVGFWEERRDVVMRMSAIVYALTAEIAKDRTPQD